MRNQLGRRRLCQHQSLLYYCDLEAPGLHLAWCHLRVDVDGARQRYDPEIKCTSVCKYVQVYGEVLLISIANDQDKLSQVGSERKTRHNDAIRMKS